jgi:hypothetical protein
MFEREDLIFRDTLDRIFHRWLYGDGSSREVAGYYGGLKGSQTMEQHQRAVGRIEGIEMCITEMHNLAARMNGDSPDGYQSDRTMN